MGDESLYQNKYAKQIVDKLNLTDFNTVKNFLTKIESTNTNLFDFNSVTDATKFDETIKQVCIQAGVRPSGYFLNTASANNLSGVHNTMFHTVGYNSRKLNYSQIWNVATKEEKLDATNRFLKFVWMNATSNEIMSTTKDVIDMLDVEFQPLPAKQNTILPKPRVGNIVEAINSTVLRVVADHISELVTDISQIKKIRDGFLTIDVEMLKYVQPVIDVLTNTIESKSKIIEPEKSL